MRYALTLPVMLERAEQLFPDKEVVSRTPGGIVRHTYRQYGRRARQLAGALQTLGVRKGDRVATLAWNHHRHLEAYFGVPGAGAVLHTLNLRLPPDHLVHIINHAEDRVILVDADLVTLLEPIAAKLPTVERYIVMHDGPAPATALPRALSYEALIAEAEPVETWAALDEWDPAGICFSSATTGLPKGVTYTHRALWLHSLGFCLADTIAVSERDRVLPVVPMFHVNAWGIPFAATWMGATQILPGPRPDARVYCELIQRERVTFAAGVPTVWMAVLALLDQEPYDLSSLNRVLCGGAAPPRALIEAFERRLGTEFIHAYGMTEAAPLSHVCRLKSHMDAWDSDRRYAARARQGLLAPGLEMRVVDWNGADVPRDGATMGEVWLRGPWIADEYYRDARSAETFQDGWYRTGDVATLDAEGYLGIVDRLKDVIKSGGEWISSVDLENMIMGLPQVAEAAVVGVEHPKWQERPLACVVVKPGQALAKGDVLAHLSQKFPSWWMPDDVVFVDEVPKTSVGKFNKRALRERFAHYLVERSGA
jgi:fatty-acyl-CoA synthase